MCILIPNPLKGEQTKEVASVRSPKITICKSGHHTLPWGVISGHRLVQSSIYIKDFIIKSYVPWLSAHICWSTVPKVRKGNEKDVATYDTTKTGKLTVSGYAWALLILVRVGMAHAHSRVLLLAKKARWHSYNLSPWLLSAIANSHPAFSISNFPTFACTCHCAAGTLCVGVHVWHRAVPMYASSPAWFFSGTRLGHVCTC